MQLHNFYRRKEHVDHVKRITERIIRIRLLISRKEGYRKIKS